METGRDACPTFQWCWIPWYVDHHNFRLDLKILFLTFKKFLLRHGISAPGDATMPEFFGSETSRTANNS